MLEMTSKLRAHSTSLINMISINAKKRKSVKKRCQDYQKETEGYGNI